MIKCIFIIACALLVRLDSSTPVGAARSLYDAVNRGDEAALAEHFYAADDLQRRLVAAYAHFVIQGKRLNDVLRQKFPGTADAPADAVISAPDIEKLDDAVVVQKDDLATIKLSGRSKPLQLKRSGDRWQLVITELGTSPETNVVEQVSLINEFAKAFSDTADEIAGDKFATPKDAQTALQTKVTLVLNKAVKSVPPIPASAPSTQPAK